MQDWLLSIVGVVCLGLLLEIVMPDGQTTKYVRGAFSLLVIFVVVSPLPSFFKNGAKLELGEISVYADESYVAGVDDRIVAEKESKIKTALSQNGYDADVKITTTGRNNTDIVEIVVKIQKSVLTDENVNKHIVTVRELTSKIAQVDESTVSVEIYGSS